jgi:hypothetical protein
VATEKIERPIEIIKLLLMFSGSAFIRLMLEFS